MIQHPLHTKQDYMTHEKVTHHFTNVFVTFFHQENGYGLMIMPAATCKQGLLPRSCQICPSNTNIAQKILKIQIQKESYPVHTEFFQHNLIARK